MAWHNFGVLSYDHADEPLSPFTGPNFFRTLHPVGLVASARLTTNPSTFRGVLLSRDTDVTSGIDSQGYELYCLQTKYKQPITKPSSHARVSLV